MLLKHADEDRFCLRGGLSKEAWLTVSYPLSISIQLLPLIVTMVEKDRVSSFDIFRERVLMSKRILIAMKLDV
jgi:hypothetical protein